MVAVVPIGVDGGCRGSGGRVGMAENAVNEGPRDGGSKKQFAYPPGRL